MSAPKTIRVHEVMNRRHIEIDGLQTVTEALEAMKAVRAKAIIVTKRDDDDEYGIVLLGDIAKKVLARDRSPKRVNIYEVMSKPVISVHPNMDVRYCARLFESFGLSVAPVIADGKVLGMVGYDDLVLDGLLNIYP